LGNIWDTLIIQPLAALLRLLYSVTGNYGAAIILFCIVAKVLLLYFAAKGKRGMMKQQRLAPKQQELQKQYGKDKAKYNEMLMKLYQQEGVSPMGGCLWSLLPLPIFFALYSLIRSPLTNLMRFTKEQVDTLKDAIALKFPDLPITGADAYFELMAAQKLVEDSSLIPEGIDPEKLINFDFWPGFNLTVQPTLEWPLNWYVLLPIVSAAFAYGSMVLTQRFSGMKQAVQGNMKFMMLLGPVMSLWFGFIMPAAMSVYWIANSVLGVVQEYFLTKHFKKVLAEEDRRREELAARRREAEERQKAEDRERRAREIEERNARNKGKNKKYYVKKQPGKPKPAPPPDKAPEPPEPAATQGEES
jgi:YidC/Oxa1 family membrane protein insertase